MFLIVLSRLHAFYHWCIIYPNFGSIAAVRALSYARRYVSDQHLMRTLSGASSSQSATHATRSHGSDGTGQGNSIFSQLTQAVRYITLKFVDNV